MQGDSSCRLQTQLKMLSVICCFDLIHRNGLLHIKINTIGLYFLLRIMESMFFKNLLKGR